MIGSFSCASSGLDVSFFVFKKVLRVQICKSSGHEVLGTILLISISIAAIMKPVFPALGGPMIEITLVVLRMATSASRGLLQCGHHGVRGVCRSERNVEDGFSSICTDA